jgi:single-stranded-DNA-specific exonuclease
MLCEEVGNAWLDAHGSQAMVVPHHDADGLSAGVLLARRAFGGVLHVESPFNGALPAVDAAVIDDWGEWSWAGRGGGDLDFGACLGAPGAAAGRRLACLLGAVGDFGDAAFRRGLSAPKSRSDVKRLATLVTAAGRVRNGPVSEAFDLLARVGDEREALAHPVCARLEEAWARTAAARARAMRTAPTVGPEAALIRFWEPARVHPLVATAWMRRLAPRVVIAANDGWRDGLVSFAVRSADGRDLRRCLLARYRPPAGAGDYARGHPKATGGALMPEPFDAFAEAALAA